MICEAGPKEGAHDLTGKGEEEERNIPRRTSGFWRRKSRHFWLPNLTSLPLPPFPFCSISPTTNNYRTTGRGKWGDEGDSWERNCDCEAVSEASKLFFAHIHAHTHMHIHTCTHRHTKDNLIVFQENRTQRKPFIFIFFNN